MDSFRVAVLPGDGIGPEVMGVTTRVVEAAAAAEGVDLTLVPLPMGHDAIARYGVALPESTIAALATCDGWFMGPHDSSSYPAAERARRNPSGELRKRFDLFANIRPARAFPGVPAVCPRMDLVVVRENTEGFYADRNMAVGFGEFMPTPDLALVVGKFTRGAAARIARVGFGLARARRRRVAIVHKANVLRQAYGLFLETCGEVARDFPDVLVEDYHVDAVMAHLVRRSTTFDVVLTTNMFGDILSDLTGELSGSLGMAPSINVGVGRAMAQAAHGSAPDIAGRGVANPLGLVLSAAMLLRWLGDERRRPAARRLADRIDAGVADVIERVRTPDLGGSGSTGEVAAALVERVTARS